MDGLNLTDFDYMCAGIADAIMDELPAQSVLDLMGDVISGEQFFYGIQALVQLQDIVKDHYNRSEA